MQLKAIVALTAVVVLATTACTSATTGSGVRPTIQVRGTLQLAQDTDYLNYSVTDATCDGIGGYSDISSGALVSVKDSKNKVLATSGLDEGVLGNGECDFDFTLSNVPLRQQYIVSISHRGDLTEQLAEMGRLQFSLGETD